MIRCRNCFENLVVGSSQLEYRYNWQLERDSSTMLHELETFQSFIQFRQRIIEFYGLIERPIEELKQIVIFEKKTSSTLFTKPRWSPEQIAYLKSTLQNYLPPDFKFITTDFSSFSLKQQVEVMLNSRAAILDGGGGSYVGFFLPKNAHLVLSPYLDDAAVDSYRMAHCFLKLTYYQNATLSIEFILNRDIRFLIDREKAPKLPFCAWKT